MQSTPKQIPEGGRPGHNSTQLHTVGASTLKARSGDPRRYPADDVERAVVVLRQLPVSVPHPIIVNDKHEVLVGGLFVEAARTLGLEALLVVVHAGLTELVVRLRYQSA